MRPTDIPFAARSSHDTALSNAKTLQCMCQTPYREIKQLGADVVLLLQLDGKQWYHRSDTESPERSGYYRPDRSEQIHSTVY